MKAIITGAGGFCGKHLRRHLERKDVEVHVLSLRECQGQRTHRVDCGDSAALQSLLDQIRPDYIFHLAGKRNGDKISDFTSVNILFASSLLDAAKKAASNCPLLLVGTAAEYGIVDSSHLPLTEEMPAHPTTFYGISKLCQTANGLLVAKQGLPVVIVRPFNIIGTEMPEHISIGSFARQISDIVRGAPPSLKVGNLATSRDFIDVEDMARIYWDLLQTPAAFGKIVNVCAGTSTSVSSIVNELILLSGLKIELVSDPDRFRSQDMPENFGSNLTLKQLLGVVRLRPLKETLRNIMSDSLGRPMSHPHPRRPSGKYDFMPSISPAVSTKTLTVICPVYNEADSIRLFYDELSQVLSGLGRRYTSTILFVLDRCTDSSLAILKELSHCDESLRILALSSRFGHQAALLAGMDHCDTDAVVMMDSDLQHPPAVIPELLAKFEQGYEVVFTVRQETEKRSIFRELTSKLFYRMLNSLSSVRIDASAADFRLISRRVTELFKTEMRERNQFLRGLFAWIGFKRIGVSFHAPERAAGKTKYSPVRLLRFASVGIVSFSRRPLQAAALIGFSIALIALSVMVHTILQYFLNEQLPSGWATMVILVSGIGGINLVFLGVIGEYIGGIFDEVKRRPHYIVEEKVNFGAAIQPLEQSGQTFDKRLMACPKTT